MGVPFLMDQLFEGVWNILKLILANAHLYIYNQQYIQLIRFIVHALHFWGSSLQVQKQKNPTSFFIFLPTVFEIHIILLPLHHLFKQFFQVTVVGLFFKFQCSAVVKELSELIRQILSQLIKGNGELLIQYFLIFFLFPIGFDVLPWQGALDKIQQNISYSLNVIPSALLNAQMGIQRSISGSACEILIVPVGNMIAILFQESLSKAKINQKYSVSFFAFSDNEVIGFDVPMNEGFLVDKLDSFYHLVPDHQGCFEGKFSPVGQEEILE